MNQEIRASRPKLASILFVGLIAALAVIIFVMAVAGYAPIKGKVGKKPIAVVLETGQQTVQQVVPSKQAIAVAPETGSGSQAPLVSPVPPAENIRLTNVRVIAQGAYPTWSPDGKWIAFGMGLKGGGLFIMDAEGKNPAKAVGSPYASSFGVVWTADSREIFYLERTPVQDPPYFKRRMIQSVDIYSSEVRSHPDIWDQRITRLSELPSLVQAQEPSDPLLYMVSVNAAEEMVRATTKDGKSDWLITPEKGQYIDLKLSPDKRRVLIETGVGFAIYATDGSGLLQNFGEGSSPDWSPDSRVILYHQGETDGHAMLTDDIYAINFDGTGRKQLTFSSDRLEMGPMWSPDGKQVVFSDFNEGTIYIADVVSE